MHVPKLSVKPPKIHWRKYLERKVIVLAAFCFATYVMETYLHVPRVGGIVHSFHDLTVGVLAEHLFFGIPLEG
jgi:hypothetical protein